MSNSLSSAAVDPAQISEYRNVGAIWPKLFFGAIFIILIYLILAPLVLFYSSLVVEPGVLPFEATHLSLANYFDVLSDSQTYTLVFNTAIFTIGSTTLGIGLAVAIAWLVERTNIWGRGIIFVSIVIPMAVPSMIYALAWIQLFNPSNGLINTIFENAGLSWIHFNIYSLAGMILVQGFSLASHVYLLVAASFKMLDPTWEEQSAIAGKGIFTTLLRVTLPSLKPALLAAIIFYIVVNMETFEIPGILGLTSQIHVFSTRIYWATHPESGGLPNYGLASTLSVLLLLAAMALIWLYQRQTRNAKQFVTVTGKGFRPSRINLRRFRLPITILTYIVLLFAVALPLSMLVWRSLIPFYMPPSLSALTHLASFKAYTDLFADYGLAEVVGNTSGDVHDRGDCDNPARIACGVDGIARACFQRMAKWLKSPRFRADGNSQHRHRAFLHVCVSRGADSDLRHPLDHRTCHGDEIHRLQQRRDACRPDADIEEIGRRRRKLPAGLGQDLSTRYLSASERIFQLLCLGCRHAIRELATAIMLFTLPATQVLSTEVWSLWTGGMVRQACAPWVCSRQFFWPC